MRSGGAAGKRELPSRKLQRGPRRLETAALAAELGVMCRAVDLEPIGSEEFTSSLKPTGS
jgi:hypothetical protein